MNTELQQVSHNKNNLGEENKNRITEDKHEQLTVTEKEVIGSSQLITTEEKSSKTTEENRKFAVQEQKTETNFDEWIIVNEYTPEMVDTLLDMPGEPVEENYVQWWEQSMREEMNFQDLLIAHKVIQSGKHNRFGYRIPVNSSWNLRLFKDLLQEYEDQELLEWLEFGFPISRDPNAEPL